MKKILWTITLVLFVAASLSACTSEEFPTGTYTRQDLTIELRDDGTFTYMGGDEIITEGTYSIDGDEIQWINDTWCDAEYAGTATYKWQHEDGVLSFELIGEDLCEGRREVMSINWFGPK
jgi:hypothetical protein